MALIVEDGTVVTGAESYVSVAASLTYHANRGNATWAALASDIIREQNLRKATEYMIQVYRPNWKGTRKSAVQVLDWPRSFVYPGPSINDSPLVSDLIVPNEVKNACCELALRAAAGPLLPDLTRAKSEVNVGPVGVKYDPNSVESPRYRAIDLILSPYLNSAPFNAKVSRR